MQARAPTGETFLFEGFRLDRRGLFRLDERGVFVPVVIGSRALDVLRLLMKADGDLVSKDEIMAAVWPGTIVGDNNLTVQISALRHALDRGRPEGSHIQTVAGRGYCFAAVVTRPLEYSGVSPTLAPVIGTRPPPPLSIVVLPFTNLDKEVDREYFADGITDDLTTDLSRIAGSFVIARRTAFTYKGKAVDVKQIGRELGVRYALEGSVRRSGKQVRTNTQLIDTDTGANLWADRFDRDVGDLFTLQDEITSRIAFALDLELIAAEVTSPTDHPDALDYFLRGRAALSKPQSVDAQSWLAHALAGRKHFQMSLSPAADLDRAEVLVRQVLEASPRLPLAHLANGMLLHARGDPEQAIPEYETVIKSNRNWVNVLYVLGMCKLLVGSIEETTPLVEQAIRFSPRDPFISNWYTLIGTVQVLKSRTDEGIYWLERAISINSELAFAHGHLAAAYALKGNTGRAAAELAEARRLSGDGRFASLARLRAARSWGVPKIRGLYETTYFVGLRKAGLPEE